MNEVFNSIFEISLRTLLVLETYGKQGLTSDMIAAIDFITVYGKDFGISEENLHGDNTFKFSEFAARRSSVQKAVKWLVTNGLVTISIAPNGFTYLINSRGSDYCAKFNNEYAVAYMTLMQKTQEFISQKSEREVIELINRHSVYSVTPKI